MISVDDIEDKVFDYMNKNGRSPKYILMDVGSYGAFNYFHSSKEEPTFLSIHSTLPISILSVDTNLSFLEAVA